MKKIKGLAIKLWQDESGQGTAEYVLILVGVVAVAILFKDKIRQILGNKLDDIQGAIQGVTHQ